jgi:hypothetical protein
MTASACIEAAMANGLGSALEDLEEKRLQMKRGNGKIILGAGGVDLLLAIWLMAIKASLFAFAFVTIAIVIITAIWISRRKSAMACQFKDAAIPRVLAASLPNFRYYGANCISEDEFNNCGLFMRPDRYNGKDYFEGCHDKTRLRFSMVHAEERYETTTTETDNDGHTTTKTEEHWRDIFKGLFVSADFNKHFSGRTVVNSGKAGIFSNLFGGLVKLEDPRFNAAFTVKSRDQIEARYLLTPSTMERLLQLRDKLGNFEASFVDSRLCIAVNGYNYNAFEPNLSRPFTATSVFAPVVTLLDIISLVDDLALNTRIWTKN